MSARQAHAFLEKRQCVHHAVDFVLSPLISFTKLGFVLVLDHPVLVSIQRYAMQHAIAETCLRGFELRSSPSLANNAQPSLRRMASAFCLAYSYR